MRERKWLRSSNSCSDNPQSKNCADHVEVSQSKMGCGLVAIGITFAMCGAVAWDTQPAKVLG